MRNFALLLLSACVLTACGRAPAPDDAAPVPAPASIAPATNATVGPASMPNAPDPVALPAPAPMPEGSYANYQCDDGAQIEVRFNGVAASVSWPDGRTAQLSQPSTGAADGAQVYAGPTVRIRRAGDGLRLRDGGNPETSCTETSSSA